MPSPSEPIRGASGAARHVILGIDGDERVHGFDAALRRAGLSPATVLDYRRFVEDPTRLARLFPRDGGVLRIESPGGSPDVREALARFGDPAAAATPEHTGDGRIERDHRAIHGLTAAIRCAARLTPEAVVATHDADTVALFYDKRACHAFMQARGFPVPPALRVARSFEALAQNMRAAGVSRVFVKPRFGSGAAGVVALSVSPLGVIAVSSAALSTVGGRTVLRNASKLRRTAGADAARLVDAVLALDAHVEQWAPKAGVAGAACDLRILTIGGEVAHTVLRLGAGPITNLDLGARRADPQRLRDTVRPLVWEAMLADCRRFARLFPRTFHVAFDVAIVAGGRRHVFFEVNAFGDLLRRVSIDGFDPYELQLARFPAWAARRQPVRVPA